MAKSANVMLSSACLGVCINGRDTESATARIPNVTALGDSNDVKLSRAHVVRRNVRNISRRLASSEGDDAQYEKDEKEEESSLTAKTVAVELDELMAFIMITLYLLSFCLKLILEIEVDWSFYTRRRLEEYRSGYDLE